MSRGNTDRPTKYLSFADLDLSEYKKLYYHIIIFLIKIQYTCAITQKYFIYEYIYTYIYLCIPVTGKVLLLVQETKNPIKILFLFLGRTCYLPLHSS